jgi:REP element-mobilizing transposase RayT
MARGNGRQGIVCDDVDRKRLQEQLGKAAIRCTWRVNAFAILSNHLHVVRKARYPGYAHRRRCPEWVADDELLAS